MAVRKAKSPELTLSKRRRERLGALRAKLRTLDEKILVHLNRRMQVVDSIAEMKTSLGLAIEQKDVEAKAIANLQRAKKSKRLDDVCEQQLFDLYRFFVKWSKKRQRTRRAKSR